MSSHSIILHNKLWGKYYLRVQKKAEATEWFVQGSQPKEMQGLDLQLDNLTLEYH